MKSTETRPSIAELEERIAALPPEARAAAERILAVSTTTSRLDPPPEMREWITKQFGSVDSVTTQRIVRVTNLVMMEGALFNDLRARRPVEVKGGNEVRETIERARGDPFCHPETGTPADTFGRIRGEHGITASNIAKYDTYHGVLVFDEHDPLAAMDATVIRDRLLTARRWAQAAIDEDPSAKYYFLIWNCLWRAGGSIVHGHMQMTVTRGMHYPRVELLRRRSLAYDEQHGRDYFDDLWRVHEALDLGDERDGARVFASTEKDVPLGVFPGDPAKTRSHSLRPLRGRSPRTVRTASSHTTWRCCFRHLLPTATTGAAFHRMHASSTEAIPPTRRATLAGWSSTRPASSRPIPSESQSSSAPKRVKAASLRRLESAVLLTLASSPA